MNDTIRGRQTTGTHVHTTVLSGAKRSETHVLIPINGLSSETLLNTIEFCGKVGDQAESSTSLSRFCCLSSSSFFYEVWSWYEENSDLMISGVLAHSSFFVHVCLLCFFIVTFLNLFLYLWSLLSLSPWTSATLQQEWCCSSWGKVASRLYPSGH